jgi:hypothetical protein
MITYTKKPDNHGGCSVQVNFSTGGIGVLMHHFETMEAADAWIANHKKLNGEESGA